MLPPTELHGLFVSRDPGLEAAHELRKQIVAHTADIELAVAQRRALEAELVGVEQREKLAAREIAKGIASDVANQIRADVARLPKAIKEVIAIYESISRNQTRFAEALRPAEGQLLYPLTASLPQLLLMNIYAYGDGLIPTPRGVFETPYELRQPGSVADMAQTAETMISNSLRCFDRPLASQPPPPEAA